MRRLLLQIAALSPPTQRQPRHPDDHEADTASEGAPPPGEPASVLARPRLRSRAHPVGTPGPYRVPARLRRFLVVRSPSCEWPGCAARAVRCDQDHDLAWPEGPTCTCNLGAACRRHHRVKQLGWLKRRRPAGVFWTSPTGRTTLSPWQHQPPQPAVRPVPALPKPPHPLQVLSDLELEHELAAGWPDAALFDTLGWSHRCDDDEPEADGDPFAAQLRGDTRWTLDLQDTASWHRPVDLDEAY